MDKKGCPRTSQKNSFPRKPVNQEIHDESSSEADSSEESSSPPSSGDRPPPPPPPPSPPLIPAARSRDRPRCRFPASSFTSGGGMGGSRTLPDPGRDLPGERIKRCVTTFRNAARCTKVKRKEFPARGLHASLISGSCFPVKQGRKSLPLPTLPATFKHAPSMLRTTETVNCVLCCRLCKRVLQVPPASGDD